MSMTIGTFKLNGEMLTVLQTTYAAGGIAILIVGDDDLPYSRLSVAIENLALEPGQFAVKTWNENAEMAEAARTSGLFVDSGRRVTTGHVVAEVWAIA